MLLKLVTGNGSLGTSVQRIRLRVQNGGQRKRKGLKRHNLGKCEILPAVPPDDHNYQLVLQSVFTKCRLQTGCKMQTENKDYFSSDT